MPTDFQFFLSFLSDLLNNFGVLFWKIFIPSIYLGSESSEDDRMSDEENERFEFEKITIVYLNHLTNGPSLDQSCVVPPLPPGPRLDGAGLERELENWTRQIWRRVISKHSRQRLDNKDVAKLINEKKITSYIISDKEIYIIIK